MTYTDATMITAALERVAQEMHAQTVWLRCAAMFFMLTFAVLFLWLWVKTRKDH